MNKTFLSISFGHDSSISYYNGYHLLYYKLERITKIKHDTFKNLDQLIFFIENVAQIKIENVDEICLVKGHPSSINDFCNKFDKGQISIVDHHLAHI